MTEFVFVTKEQFYAAMGPLDVHPCPEKQITKWKLVRTIVQLVVGLSTPGYLCEGDEAYQIRADLVSKK